MTASRARSSTATDSTYRTRVKLWQWKGGKASWYFDQDRDGWYRWTGSAWESAANALPVITHPHFTGTGTRTLRANSERAIEQLYQRSFGR